MLRFLGLTGALRADAGVVSVGMVRTADVTPVLVGSGQLTIAGHSFGTVPMIAVLEYICLTAEQGYAAGEVMQTSAQWNGTASSTFVIFKNTSNVGVQCGSGYSIMGINRATGVAFTPTAASWAYRFVISK